MAMEKIPVADVYVLVVHQETGRAYALNRQYEIVIYDINIAEVRDCPEERKLVGWRNSPPGWASVIPRGEFTAYWMY